MSKLQELVSKAQSDIAMYRHPNLDEVRKSLDEILEALGESQIGYDRITSIYEEDGNLTINTAYELRCCAMTGEHFIPLQVFNVEDPMLAAKQFVVKNALKELQETRARYQEELDGIWSRRELLQNLISKAKIAEEQKMNELKELS